MHFRYLWRRYNRCMTTYHPPLPFTPPARPRAQWTGWGISLAAHAGVLAWLMHLVPPRPPEMPGPARMRFVLMPPRAPVPVKIAPAPAEPAAQTPAVRKPSATPARPSRTRPVPVNAPEADAPPKPSDEATPVITATEPSPAAAAPADSDKPDSDAPAFDMAAARASARLIARRAKDSTVALPERKAPSYDPDDTAQHGLERARRNDCRSAYSGLGLLAVLPLLKDAVTGSGCKW